MICRCKVDKIRWNISLIHANPVKAAEFSSIPPVCLKALATLLRNNL